MRRGLLIFPLVALGCGGARVAPALPDAIAAGRCDATLPDPIARSPQEARSLRLMRGLSSIPFDVAIDLRRAQSDLESQLPTRLADEHGRDLGTAGKLTLTIDRSPFRLAVDGGRLFVRTDLTAHARICKPLGVFGCVQYASCDPTAVASASVDQALTADERFAPSRVAIDFGERCVLTALHIDVTDVIAQAAHAETQKVEKRIDGALPDLRPQAERAWKALSQTIPLRQGACVALHPTSLVQGPSRIEGDKLVVRLGVIASPSVTMPCAPAEEATKLPPLRFDGALSDAFILHVPVSLTAAALETDWRSQIEGKTLAAGDAAFRINAARVAMNKGAVALDVDVGGPACGVVSFDVAPAWDAAKQLLTFAVTPIDGEVERLRGVVATSDAVALGRAIGAELDMTLPVDDASLATALDGLKVPLAQGGPELAVVVSDHAPEALTVTSDAVEPSFVLKGRAKVDVRDLR